MKSETAMETGPRLGRQFHQPGATLPFGYEQFIQLNIILTGRWFVSHQDPLLTPTDLSIMVKIVNGIKFGAAVELIPQPKIGVSHKLVVVNPRNVLKAGCRRAASIPADASPRRTPAVHCLRGFRSAPRFERCHRMSVYE
ncbi:hypothetical protein V6767_17890 [Martelella sp. FLE1502]